MNSRKRMIAVIMIIAAASATLYTRKASSPEAKRDRLNRDFTAVMPERYDVGQRKEVSELLARFNHFYDERRVSEKQRIPNAGLPSPAGSEPRVQLTGGLALSREAA